MNELCASDWAIVRQMVSDFIGDMEAMGMESYKVRSYLLEVEQKLEEAKKAEAEVRDLEALLGE